MEKLSRANTILETTNKELERFASTVSHDLKEPLRKIALFSNMMLQPEDYQLPKKYEDYLSKIVSSSKRMHNMIEDILNFSLLSTKDHFEKCSLQAIVSDTVDLLEHGIEEKRAKIYYADLPEAIVIPSQMRQLFQNLISNSLKFSKKEEPPRIHIGWQWIKGEEVKGESLWPSEQYLKITLKDNGIGFEQENAESIFNHFNRLHGKAAYEGTGLGLAISKKIAENHGGTITARSEAGRGAEFTVIIPG